MSCLCIFSLYCTDLGFPREGCTSYSYEVLMTAMDIKILKTHPQNHQDSYLSQNSCNSYFSSWRFMILALFFSKDDKINISSASSSTFSISVTVVVLQLTCSKYFRCMLGLIKAQALPSAGRDSCETIYCASQQLLSVYLLLSHS